MTFVPDARVSALNDAGLRGDGDFVLYWMVTQRRLEWNYALDQAVGYARKLGVPLVILEALRVGYRWSSPRHHRFALDGMREHRQRLADGSVTYLAYVEPEEGAGKGLLETLASRAAVIVTDDYPVFFVPRMQHAAGRALDVRLERVDSNGLLPMRSAGRTFFAAQHFRRHLHKNLPALFGEAPEAAPFDGGLPEGPAPLPDGLLDRWPMASPDLLDGDAELLRGLPLEYDVAPAQAGGGRAAARERLERFLTNHLDDYGEGRNHPDDGGASGLSPWLHWGHLSAHEIFDRLTRREEWTPARVSDEVTARREGWWGMSKGAEAWLDELITWREIGFNFAVERPDYDQYDSLPDWARKTLAEHAADPREHVYDLDAFDAAATHDPLWNAAQRQLRREGVIHNYLRMLWGKKILEWTPDPRAALEIMIELNNRYALDGRDPNSYSGIFWVLGRFDRGWPERAVYGTVRSMSSESTRRKVRLTRYLDRFGETSD
ncbi:MAG: deoxyribodipyrimidine photolyase [Gemmatimonadetes bacterium]|nr:deoxyribodipyrimidine photolyase [Gemmatimonadota bacterium]